MGRVELKPVEDDDADELVAANQRNRAYHRPWAEPFETLEDFRMWRAEGRGGSMASLIVREAGSGGIVGVVNLSQIFRKRFQNAYLGFYSMAEFGGRGLMTEGVGLAVRYAFRDLELHRLEANIQPGNTRSLSLVSRVGFRREGFSPRYLMVGGEWRDHERWALLADEAK